MKIPSTLNEIGRLWRLGVLIALFLMLATIVRPGPRALDDRSVEAWVRATAVPLDARDPQRRRVGELYFRRGWSLAGSDPRFGAISAMSIEAGRVIALSDAGTVLLFDLPAGSVPASRLRLHPLPRSSGAGKLERDTEAMVVDRDKAWIAFERRNRVARFRTGDWSERAGTNPAAMRRWGRNSGAEAMVRLAGDRFLVLAEGPRGAETSPAILFLGDPADPATRSVALRYRPPSGFRLTDADLLPDGRLLLLHRRFGWLEGVSAKLTISETDDLRAGATIVGREIAELRPPLTVGNMEALSVAREGGRTIVRVASDNNFMRWQPNLLLEFALVERRPRRSPPRPAS